MLLLCTSPMEVKEDTIGFLKKPPQEHKVHIDQSPPKVRKYIVPETGVTHTKADPVDEDRGLLFQRHERFNQFL